MTADTRSSAAIVPLPGRDNSGRFTSEDNPGRRLGSKNRVSNEALQAVRSMKDGAIAQLRQRLANNDWNALQFILERILPKGRVLEIDATSPQSVADALAAGTLTTDEAKNVATVLEKLASIEEITDLRRRIEALEGYTNGGR